MDRRQFLARSAAFAALAAAGVELILFAGGDGTVFTTQQALVDMKSGTVSGNSPVQGSGPLGQISA